MAIGIKCNLVSGLVIFVLGMLIACNLVCSCSNNNLLEGFSTGDDSSPQQEGKSGSSYVDALYGELDGNVGGPVPLPDNQLSIFNENKFKPECCTQPQQYSNSSGCACISVEQMKYLNSRGGNNTRPH